MKGHNGAQEGGARGVRGSENEARGQNTQKKTEREKAESNFSKYFVLWRGHSDRAYTVKGRSPRCPREKERNQGAKYAEKNGEGGIRTLGRVAPTSVFKTDALNHSATSPYLHSNNFSGRVASIEIRLPRYQCYIR